MVGQHEHLDREHTDIIEGGRDLFGDRARLRGQEVRDRGRRARNLEDMVAVLVFGDVVTFDVAVG